MYSFTVEGGMARLWSISTLLGLNAMVIGFKSDSFESVGVGLAKMRATVAIQVMTKRNMTNYGKDGEFCAQGWIYLYVTWLSLEMSEFLSFSIHFYSDEQAGFRRQVFFTGGTLRCRCCSI